MPLIDQFKTFTHMRKDVFNLSLFSNLFRQHSREHKGSRSPVHNLSEHFANNYAKACAVPYELPDNKETPHLWLQLQNKRRFHCVFLTGACFKAYLNNKFSLSKLVLASNKKTARHMDHIQNFKYAKVKIQLHI